MDTTQLPAVSSRPPALVSEAARRGAVVLFEGADELRRVLVSYVVTNLFHFHVGFL